MTEFPPKTCTIERLITKPDDVAKVLNGQKTATRRNGRYADPGEIMQLQGQAFMVTDVYQQTLEDLTDESVRAEGFDTVESYRQYILSLHSGMPWLPHMTVWVHEFRPVREFRTV